MKGKDEHGVKSMTCSFMVPSEVVRIPRAPDISFLNCKSTKICIPKPTERRFGDLGQFVSFALFPPRASEGTGLLLARLGA